MFRARAVSIAARKSAPCKSLFGYDVLDVLGHGAGSTIYLAVEPGTGQVRAVKHLIRSETCQTRLVQQMQTEFEVARQLGHPGLRRCLDLKLSRTLLHNIVDALLVMELFDGVSLEQSSPPALPQILDCAIQAAHALDSLHAMGYVHCDLKPNNILINEDGQVKIIDFGQSCKAGTIKERIQGTPDFIAPEQVQLQPLTPRTDIFCLGATLYSLLTGQKIPTCYTAARKKNSFVLDQSIPEPTALNPGVPPLVSALVMECIRSNPAKRLGDMKQLAYRLELAQYKVEHDHQAN